MSEADKGPDRSGLSLAAQFALAGGVVILAAALAVGSVVAARIEETVVRNTANATALYMESFIAPIIQDTTEQDTLTSRWRKDIPELLANTELGRRVVSFKIWRKDGFITNASNKDLIGQTFEVTDNLRKSWQGQVQGDFENNNDPEDAAEGDLGLPLLEIYTPIRSRTTGDVIAVVEFYEIAETLQGDIRQARLLAWSSVIGTMSVIWAALFLIVLRGSRTIDAQIVALKEMSVRNLSLRLQIQEAAARSVTMGERALRQIGADLHDGPAQLMGFAALRLDAMKGAAKDSQFKADLAEVGTAVAEAITEIRNLSRGLSVPDLERRDMLDMLQSLADVHVARVGSAVTIDSAQSDLPDLPAALRVCIYRFVQEGLNNAWRHAGGRGQELRLVYSKGKLTLSVLDQGTNFPPEAPLDSNSSHQRLGLVGLKNRVEALGGQLEFLRWTDTETGAELRMTTELKEN
jgi:signal transduction histidine kinase